MILRTLLLALVATGVSAQAATSKFRGAGLPKSDCADVTREIKAIHDEMEQIKNLANQQYTSVAAFVDDIVGELKGLQRHFTEWTEKGHPIPPEALTPLEDG